MKINSRNNSNYNNNNNKIQQNVGTYLVLAWWPQMAGYSGKKHRLVYEQAQAASPWHTLQ